jgi:cytochrome c2
MEDFLWGNHVTGKEVMKKVLGCHVVEKGGSV